MTHSTIQRWGIYPAWLLLFCTLAFRQPIPIDETRYLSVAWEMWLRNDFLTPYLNGQPYSHKPPLLFWLMQVGWGLFGLNEWWPRTVGPLAALGNLWLIRHLAGKLWPDDKTTALIAPWLLLSTLLWTLFAMSTMFDMLLTDFVLLGMLGLFHSQNGQSRRGWLYFGLAIGLGILAKGPVVLLHLLPTALSVKFWRPSRSNLRLNWYVLLLLAVLGGACFALSWAIPAASHGGEAYGKAILWSQTADRTLSSQIHRRALWWYLPFIPLLFFPWIALPQIWRRLRAAPWRTDRALRFCAIWASATVIVFSLLSSKQIHYLIPMTPALALLVARASSLADKQLSSRLANLLPTAYLTLIGCLLVYISHIPGLSKLAWAQALHATWGAEIITTAIVLCVACRFGRTLPVTHVASAIVVCVFAGLLHFFNDTGLAYNLRPAALMIKNFQDRQVPCAFIGNYQGQFQFLGRLEQPLAVVTEKQAPEWARQHPDGYLISLEKTAPRQAEYSQLHRENWLIFRTAQQMLMKQDRAN